jgi:hypothetical protein
MGKCKAGLRSKDGKENLNCDRDRRHIAHEDSKAGKRFTRVPGGAIISKKK